MRPLAWGLHSPPAVAIGGKLSVQRPRSCSKQPKGRGRQHVTVSAQCNQQANMAVCTGRNQLVEKGVLASPSGNELARGRPGRVSSGGCGLAWGEASSANHLPQRCTALIPDLATAVAHLVTTVSAEALEKASKLCDKGAPAAHICPFTLLRCSPTICGQ